MKNRDIYLNQLIAFKDKPLIKVITGLRRSGKSSLLLLFEEYLLRDKVSSSNIIRLNFESLELESLKDHMKLYSHIKNLIGEDKSRYYLLLDEIQQVQSWEKVVNSLIVDYNVDVYITGSNAYLLSSELSTLLAGRYVEIKMLPLSFKEYLDFINYDDKQDTAGIFNDYIKFGGLPTIAELLDNKETIGPFLEGIYNTVLMKDVIERNQVRDVALLDSILKFVASNIGNIISTNRISNYLTSNGRKASSETVDNYLKMLENAFIIYKANRFDLKGKMFLKTLEKYYIVDTGIRNKLTGLGDTDYGHILENVVFFELMRRGYNVSIGKIDSLEVDFVAASESERIYIQVSASIMDETTRNRELKSLQNIPDNYPKYILTMDKTIYDDFSGIRVKNIIDFLLE